MEMTNNWSRPLRYAIETRGPRELARRHRSASYIPSMAPAGKAVPRGSSVLLVSHERHHAETCRVAVSPKPTAPLSKVLVGILLALQIFDVGVILGALVAYLHAPI